MIDFTLKRGDTSPAIEATLTDENGDAIDLTNASVQFHMEPSDDPDGSTVDAAATIVDASTGQVAYDWADGDTDEPGYYAAEFAVTYADSSTETYPNYEHLAIKIMEDIQ